RPAIGLHLTLTAPFRPLTSAFLPLHQNAFPQLQRLSVLALLRRLQPTLLAAEIDAQLTAFMDAFGTAPAFIDGHQHVHLLPQVREEVLLGLKARAPGAWVRQCASTTVWHGSDRKAILLWWLSRGLRRRA